MTVVLVSSSNILIIQVKKEDDESNTGKVYVCPSALLVTSYKYTDKRKNMLHDPIYIYIYIYIHICAYKKFWPHDSTLLQMM
jgi:hypothetical protein